jgi:hypothetical protein
LLKHFCHLNRSKALNNHSGDDHQNTRDTNNSTSP